MRPPPAASRLCGPRATESAWGHCSSLWEEETPRTPQEPAGTTQWNGVLRCPAGVTVFEVHPASVKCSRSPLGQIVALCYGWAGSVRRYNFVEEAHVAVEVKWQEKKRGRILALDTVFARRH